MGARNYGNGAPLHRAAQFERPSAARALLEAGADASLTNSSHQTALDVAVKYGQHEVAACIRRAGDEARRLCGARQRLAFATAMLPSASMTSGSAGSATSGLGELPYEVLPPVGEAAAALGAADVRVAFRAADHTMAYHGIPWHTMREQQHHAG